jgi:hypothetical protein
VNGERVSFGMSAIVRNEFHGRGHRTVRAKELVRLARENRIRPYCQRRSSRSFGRAQFGVMHRG